MSRVMVVDDEPDMRLAVRLLLERYGHRVEEAASGEEACLRVQRDPPDLLLMDVRMPGQDGLETLGIIRETNKSLPIIIMTGYGNPETEREAFRKGASKYIHKPFRNEELLEAMTQVGLAEGKAKPAPRADSVPEVRRSRPPSALQRCALSLRRFWFIFRQARAIFLDRWQNPPILFERDPSFEEMISLRLSVITDPVKIIFHGLFDEDFEFPMDERGEAPGVEDSPEAPKDFHSQHRHRYAPTAPRAIPISAPVRREDQVLQEDVSRQIQSVADSLHGEINRLAEQVLPRRDPQTVVRGERPARQGIQESPQEEFHRLLIELQTTWDQGLSAVGKELSFDQEVLREWSQTLPGLRQAVDHSKAA